MAVRFGPSICPRYPPPAGGVRLQCIPVTLPRSLKSPDATNSSSAIVIGFPNYYARVFSEDLRSHFRLVFVDHRGSAASPGSVDTAEFALERIVDDVELVRETLGLGRIAVIGHSGHAFMALEYAKKYPANVSHVVMIGIAPDFSASSRQVAQQNWLRLASLERKSALEENQRKITYDQLAQLPPGERWIKSYVRDGPRAWYDPHFDSTPLWEDVDVNMEMFNYVWGELFSDIDVTRGLENFDRPVFMALGRYDFLVAQETHDARYCCVGLRVVFRRSCCER